MEFSHPNIIAIRDYGYLNNGDLYFAMDFIQGKTLKEVISQEKPLSIARALNIAKQILDALCIAHEKSIVHRDLKPLNLMIEQKKGEDHVVVLDFGIAKQTDGVNKMVTQGILGTPLYMSPEQMVGKVVDGRSDLFSLGLMLHEMLTGNYPRYAVVNPNIIKEENPHLPLAICKMISKSLQPEPSQRFQSSEEFINAINTYIEDSHQTK